MYKMKPKNKIKLHKSVVEVISSTTELVNSMIDLHKQRFNYKIPDYTKGGIHKSEFAIVNDIETKEKIVLPDRKTVDVPDHSKEWSENLNNHLKEKGIEIGATIDIIKHCVEVGKNIDSLMPKYNPRCMYGNYKPITTLKSILINGEPHNIEHKGNGIYNVKNKIDFQKGMVDADNQLQDTCLNQQQEYKIDKFYDLRGIFSRYTRQEILNSPELKTKGIDVLKKALSDLENS